MDRMINIALRISLLLAAIGSLLSLVKMIVEQFTPISYYWWASVAFFGATVVLAAAIRIRDDHGTSSPNSPLATRTTQA